MKIDKFVKQEFGELTTITNEKTGVVMFIGKQIAELWGHSNLKQAVNRLCNEDEFKVIKLSKFTEFKALLVSNKMLPTKAQSIMLLRESAVYKLALSSNLEKAKPFKDWVAGEVLPSIRKNGFYSIANNNNHKMMLNMNITFQKQNSKDINAKNYIENGIDAVIEHNRNSCLLHTGKTPSQIKKEAKLNGLASTKRTSAKEVLRNTKPELACAMSFTDGLVKMGFDLKTSSELAMRAALPLYQGLLELGITPTELNE